MSLTQKETTHIYVGSAIFIILIIFLISGAVSKSTAPYKQGEKIAVKTSKGLIKMNAESIADELARVRAELSKHEGHNYTSNHSLEIQSIVDHIRQFIKNNPRDADVCKGDIKASVIENAMNDRITPDVAWQSAAHDTILSHIDHVSDEQLFEYLLKNIDITIHLLQRDVCDNGLLDLESLESILRKLDAEIYQDPDSYDFDKSQPILSDISSRYDPYAIPKLSLFASQATQLEGFSTVSQIRGYPGVDAISLGPYQIRNAQQRSQMFRENRQKMGVEHYIDEDLLFTPTYNTLAL